ncbi:MAG: hypothetical protein EBY64_09590, partial [Rhodobacteraceae bacterium]|nr:hypothetical protein [Paracoccaceae bacterium]
TLALINIDQDTTFSGSVEATDINNAASTTATFSDNVTATITNSGTLLFDATDAKSVTGAISEAADGDTTEIKVINSANSEAPSVVTFTSTVAADTLTIGTTTYGGAALFEEAVTTPTINVVGGDHADEDSTATFNKAVTASSGITLNDQTGDAKIIFAENNSVTITGTIDGASSDEGTIQVTGATKTFASAIGGTQDLTLIDIDNTSTFNEAISATNINVADSITATAKKAITATAIVLDGGTLVLSDNNSVTIAGTINGSNTTEGTLQITGATKTFSGAIGTTQALTLIDVDNAAIFNGSIEATTLSVAASNYALELNGAANVITNAVTFSNTGALTLGDANTDSSTFNGGITATAPSGVTLAGTIQTSGDTISIGDGDTAITLAANTTVDGNTAGAITLAGAIDGGYSLTLNTTGTTTLSAEIGGSTALTTLTTNASGTTVISADITTSSTQTYNDAV